MAGSRPSTESTISFGNVVAFNKPWPLQLESLLGANCLSRFAISRYCPDSRMAAEAMPVCRRGYAFALVNGWRDILAFSQAMEFAYNRPFPGLMTPGR